MIAVLRRYVSAIHYVDHGRQSFENAKTAIAGLKATKATKQINLIITEAEVAFKLLEDRLQELLPKMDTMLSYDFDQIDVESI